MQVPDIPDVRIVAANEASWGELNVGPGGAFLEAGFREVTHPSKRRVAMRIDF